MRFRILWEIIAQLKFSQCASHHIEQKLVDVIKLNPNFLFEFLVIHYRPIYLFWNKI
jgi:hypothetical protein